MKFSQVIGHTALKKRLIQSVSDNRVSHAQLFLGPTGRGSLALALAYAQYIACENKHNSDSCGTCNACIKYNKYVHPDLHFAYPVPLNKEKGIKSSTDLIKNWREQLSDNPYLSVNDWYDSLDAENKQPTIGVEESAEILRKLTLKSYESEYKVMIIWPLDTMNATAANKLLKILEEPPEKTLFLLVCENEEQLLRTVLSRTQLVKIHRIDDNSLTQALIEQQGVSTEQAAGIVQLAEGNYRAAQLLVSESEQVDRNLLFFQNWMRACLKFDPIKITALTTEFAALGREQQKILLQYCLHLVRECLMLNYKIPQLEQTLPKEKEFLAKFAPFIHSGNCLQFTDELNRAYNNIVRNAAAKLLFVDISFKFNELLNIKATISG